MSPNGGSSAANDTLTGLGAVRVGHASTPGGGSGLTVILFDPSAVGSALLLGGATSTRQVDGLLPHHTGGEAHAVLFSGGSAFGLDAAGGVVRYLEEKGAGLDLKLARIPVVPTSVIFDLPFSLAKGGVIERPSPDLAYEACATASSERVQEGSVGAGTGATVGKFNGFLSACKGGVGSALCEIGPEMRVAALAVVNAFGDIVDAKTGGILAGARTAEGGFLDTEKALRSGRTREDFLYWQHTTLLLVATDADLPKRDLAVVARMASTGLARVIRPFQTPVDGDVVMAFSLKRGACDVKNVGAAAAHAACEAVVRAVQQADGLAVVPAWKDLHRKPSPLYEVVDPPSPRRVESSTFQGEGVPSPRRGEG